MPPAAFTKGLPVSTIGRSEATPVTWVVVLKKADVPTTVRGAEDASTLTPVARFANTLLSRVGPALSCTSTPIPWAAGPP